MKPQISKSTGIYLRIGRIWFKRYRCYNNSQFFNSDIASYVTTPQSNYVPV